MAGTLVVSTLSDGTNSTSATDPIRGSARAWVNFNGTTSPGTIRAAYNVSSVSYIGVGNYVVNYTNAFSDTNYAVALACRRDNSDSNIQVSLRGAIMSGGALYSTTQTAVMTRLPNSTNEVQADIVCLTAFR